MRYLLFEYGESPTYMTDIPPVKYDYEKNLNVLKSNNTPAICVLDNCVTETGTKVHNESPDSDNNFPLNFGTQTFTLVDTEQSDSDEDSVLLSTSLITMTTTRVEMESTDSD